MFKIQNKELLAVCGGLGDCSGDVQFLLENNGLNGLVQQDVITANQKNDSAQAIQDTCTSEGVDISSGFIMTGMPKLQPIISP